MARILSLYALIVVAIMKSTASTAATTTAEGTTELVTIMITGQTSGPMTGTTTDSWKGSTTDNYNNTTLPMEPNTTLPMEPNTTLPMEPNTTLPMEPNTTLPMEPNTTTPTEPNTTLPMEPNTTLPMEPYTTLPMEPNTTLPMETNTTLPMEPNTTLPMEPNTTLPMKPNTTLPMEPNTTLPMEPNTTLPMEPNTTLPMEPNTTLPTESNTTLPMEPNTTLPMEPNTTLPMEPNTTTPMEPNTTTPMEPNTTLPMEPNTTTPTEPNTTLPMEPNTTLPMELNTTLPMEPNTTLPTECNTTLPMEPNTTLPMEPNTTLPMEPNTTLPMEPNTTTPMEPNTTLPMEPKTTPKTTPPTELKTEPPSEPSTEEPPRVGPVPEPTLPDIEGDAHKTYHFEFAVEEDTTEGCTSDDLTSTACDTFKYNMKQELEAVYGESDAFLSVEVDLRFGSLIVSHNVTYSYNEMSDEERMASPQDIYDDTLGSAVADGDLGDYTVQEDCGNCASPEETTDNSEAVIECESEYSKATYKPYYWVCESICVSESDYCNSHGICWQRGNMNTQPICSCDWENGVWYWGYRCQYYMNQTYLIIGCSCGAAVLLVFLVCLIACCVVKSKAVPDKESQPSDDVINAFQNFAYDHTAETVIFPPIDDNNIDDGDILQRSRPYSYIYSKGEGSTNVGSSSFIGNQNGGAQRESRPEVNEDAAKRQSNGSADNRHSSLMKPNGSSSQQRNSDFWGNLNDPSVEHIKLEPFLDRYDDNDSYKIRRPRISAHYDYSNNSAAPNIYQSMDPAHTEHIPEADYAQR